MNKFDELFSLDVNDKIEKRTDGNVELSYLSWAWAWAKFKKAYPDAKYEIKKFEVFNDVATKSLNEGTTKTLPYMFDENTGYMVNTTITAGDLTYEMWLPVMDNKNKAMKNKPYKYTTKYGDKNVEQATMFDVNKAIMRCLVKNMAMFGLGLYIYAGEDLPEKLNPEEEKPKGNLIPDEEIKKLTLSEEIRECQTEEQLKKLYRGNKTKITGDKKLLDLITKRAEELKETA